MFAYAKTNAQISCVVTFVFPTGIVQFLIYPKFQDSSFLLCAYRPACVGPGRKSQRPVFSRHSSGKS